LDALALASSHAPHVVPGSRQRTTLRWRDPDTPTASAAQFETFEFVAAPGTCCRVNDSLSAATVNEQLPTAKLRARLPALSH
jgi:hypothetical protein